MGWFTLSCLGFILQLRVVLFQAAGLSLQTQLSRYVSFKRGQALIRVERFLNVCNFCQRNHSSAVGLSWDACKQDFLSVLREMQTELSLWCVPAVPPYGPDLAFETAVCCSRFLSESVHPQFPFVRIDGNPYEDLTGETGTGYVSVGVAF